MLFDPAAEWVVGEATGQSLSTNTPLHGVRLRGRVLLTLSDGRIAHHDEHIGRPHQRLKLTRLGLELCFLPANATLDMRRRWSLAVFRAHKICQRFLV